MIKQKYWCGEQHSTRLLARKAFSVAQAERRSPSASRESAAKTGSLTACKYAVGLDHAAGAAVRVSASGSGEPAGPSKRRARALPASPVPQRRLQLPRCCSPLQGRLLPICLCSLALSDKLQQQAVGDQAQSTVADVSPLCSAELSRQRVHMGGALQSQWCDESRGLERRHVLGLVQHPAAQIWQPARYADGEIER